VMRVGIELSPAACRIVEVDGGPPWRRSQGETHVRSFAILPPSGPETRAKLESLRRRHAAVIVWGGRSEHRQVMVTAGSYESMRAEAMASLSAAGLQTTGAWADIAPAWSPGDRAALDDLGVKVYDLSSEPSDWIGHGVYANAPAVLKTIGAQIAEPRPQDAEVQAVLGEKPIDPSIIATPLPPVDALPYPPAAQIH